MEKARQYPAVRLLAALMMVPSALAAQVIEAPSGASAELLDIRLDDTTQTARFRFVVEGLGQAGLTYMDMAADMVWMCEDIALPALADNSWDAREVIITLADRPVEFGVTDPDAVQFFEGFAPSAETCEVAGY